MLPIFARSLEDTSAAVRTAAVSQIGNLCIDLSHEKRQAELEISIEFLAAALEDESDLAKYAAGEYLLRLGRRDMVPERLMRELGLGEEKVGG
jgi:hypothetical protein